MTRIHRTANRIYSELGDRANSFYSDIKFIVQESKSPSKAQSSNPDDIRLIGAATPVILLAALIFGFAYTSRFAPILSLATDQELIAQMRKERGNIDPVLIEQPEYLERRTQQRSVLSDQTSEGRGGITTLYGFHTLTDSDRLQLGQGDGGSPATPGSRPQTARPNRMEPTETDRPGDTMPDETAANRADNAGAQTAATGDGGGQRMRIPTNYRFQEQFRLRYDGSSLYAMSTTAMPGAEYFRNMLRQIRQSFAPPGVNYMYRDRAGYVINEPIKPQVVPVMFMLDRDGNVVDVKKGPTIGQHLVDEACMNALRDQNFGKPPPEIFEHGNIFGINFVFPPLY